MVATQDIKKGDLVLAVPHTMWITIDAVCIDSPLCAKLNTNGELPKLLSQPWMNNFYAVFLIEQSKLKESKYNAYLKSLPLDMSNYPTLLS